MILESEIVFQKVSHHSRSPIDPFTPSPPSLHRLLIHPRDISPVFIANLTQFFWCSHRVFLPPKFYFVHKTSRVRNSFSLKSVFHRSRSLNNEVISWRWLISFKSEKQNRKMILKKRTHMRVHTRTVLLVLYAYIQIPAQISWLAQRTDQRTALSSRNSHS